MSSRRSMPDIDLKLEGVWMDARSKIRRMALVCAGALAIVPLTAAPATAQDLPIPTDPEALCDEAPDEAEALFGPICEQVADDNGENGDDNGAPIPTDPEELCALQDEAPEELGALFDALGVVIDEVCPPEEEPEEPEEDPADPEEPTDPVEPDDPGTTDDTDDTEPLPVTGGAAGLLGLGLLGAGMGLRRLRRLGGELG